MRRYRVLQSLVGSLRGFIAHMVCLDDRLAAAHFKDEGLLNDNLITTSIILVLTISIVEETWNNPNISLLC